MPRRNGYLVVDDTTEHRLLAERALGKPLPYGSIVHHFDGSTDNRRGNLVLCPSQAYHALLHTRQEALEACSHAHWRKCWICKQWDDPVLGNMYTNAPIGNVYHRACKKIQEKEWQSGVRRSTKMKNSGLTCSETGCSEASSVKGLCQKHYRKKRDAQRRSEGLNRD